MQGAAGIRAFIAIELPPEVRRALGVTLNRLRRPDDRHVKWVDPAGIHITLIFLGNIRPDQVDPVTEVMRAATAIPPFELSLDQPGAFPNPHRVQIVWVGLKGDLTALGELQKRLASGLTPLGFAPENRPYRAHLTLARLRDTANPEARAEMGQRLSESGIVPAAALNVSAISLMQSHLTPQGARYHRLTSAPLNHL
jgi:RNA 2',3'-cyclic 3'-phosphodiesterase